MTIVGFRQAYKQGNSDNIVCVSNGQREGWIKPSNIQQILRHQVFVSYSHADTKWLERLRVFLAPLEREGIVDRWDDSRIRPGQRWREEITNALQQAKVAVLLVSADFLASDFIASNELPPLLSAAESDGAVIIPVIVGHSRFMQHRNLSQFQAANNPSEPLSGMTSTQQEAMLLKVTEAIESALAS